jgi:hypothetical protein
LFDPGDLSEIQQIYRDQLSPAALYDYIVNVKRQEILAPNLPLAWRIYAVDGYDGGVLPLKTYIRLQRLLLDEQDILTDGRLREGLERIPPTRLLSILGARYVITDKVHDVWIDNVFYDLAFDTALNARTTPSVSKKDLPPYSATGLGIVTYLDGAQETVSGMPVAEVRLTTTGGKTLVYPLRAGLETAEGVHNSSMQHAQARIGRRWQHTEKESSQEGFDYVARLDWEDPSEVSRIEIVALPFGPQGAGQLHIRGVSLLDRRDGSNVPVLLSTRGQFNQVHSGDVKVYEALDVLPRAYAVHHTRVIDDDTAALAAMADPAFDPARTAILAAGHELGDPQSDRSISPVTVLSYEPEEIILQASLPEPGYVVLSDSWYPGWKATVDGQEATTERANLSFRAVHVPQGTHTVRWTYQSKSFLYGAGISAITLLAIVAACLALFFRRRPSVQGSLDA